MRRIVKAASARPTRRIVDLGALTSIVFISALTMLALLAMAASASAAGCPNEAIREQQGATAISNCRGYEKISPVDKNGLDVTGANVGGGIPQVAPDGNALSYQSPGAFPDTSGAWLTQTYVARRGGAGWARTDAMPSLGVHFILLGLNPPVYAFNETLTKDIVYTNSPLNSEVTLAGPKIFNTFVHDLPTDSYRLVTTVPATEPDPWNGAFANSFSRYGGASADFGRVVFESPGNFVPGASGTKEKLYEWSVDSSPGLRLITSGLEGGVAGSGSTSPFGGGASRGSLSHVVSEDGSRIFFTVPGPGASIFSVVSGQIYLQEGTSRVQITASERTDGSGSPEPDPAGPQNATYWTASPNGTRVLFTTSEQLTDDDRNSSSDLYEYNLASPAGHHLTRLSLVDDDPESPNPSGVEGVVGTSRDLSTVYFTAAGQLVPGEGADFTGEPNLYMEHDGDVRYIATLDGGTNIDVASGYIGNRTRDVTPDGAYLAFQSNVALPACGDPAAPSVCATNGFYQAYIYEAGTHRLHCASCPQDGSAATGESGLAPPSTEEGLAPGLQPLTVQSPFTAEPSNLSDDGRLFFTSRNSLVSRDSNGASDVYEWDHGRLELVSSGQNVGPSNFMAASPSGRDVYFITLDRLVNSDTDTLFDLYDAREDGGFPEPQPPSPACGGGSCRGAAPPPPGTNATSEEVRGPGNSVPRDPKAKKKSQRHHRRDCRHRSKKQCDQGRHRKRCHDNRHKTRCHKRRGKTPCHKTKCRKRHHQAPGAKRPPAAMQHLRSGSGAGSERSESRKGK